MASRLKATNEALHKAETTANDGAPKLGMKSE
jgi:hypothetical protein